MFTGINLFSMFVAGWCAGCALHLFCQKDWAKGAIHVGLALLNLALVFI